MKYFYVPKCGMVSMIVVAANYFSTPSHVKVCERGKAQDCCIAATKVSCGFRETSDRIDTSSRKRSQQSKPHFFFSFFSFLLKGIYPSSSSPQPQPCLPTPRIRRTTPK